ncbi:putative transmembrane domain-containing protein [Cryptosporidium canis]|nr:putative transmembrane domain-containing protein [Cryptosporidium canis]
MIFEKRIRAILLSPFRKIIGKRYLKYDIFNKHYFDISGKRNRHCFYYKVFSISTSIALISRFYFRNVKPKWSIEVIPASYIEPLSSMSKNLIVLSVASGTDIDKNSFIKELIKQIKCRELREQDIDIYYVESDIYKNNTYKASLYKGYGTVVSNIDLYDWGSSIEQIKSFFIPKSNKSSIDQTSVVKNVTYETFERDVIHASSEEMPLLLMYYDDSCLMCFLLRPLLNSLAARVKDSAKIKFARYNIERNDIHDFSPQISATPTFVLYRGGQNPEKWDEYRPADLINRIIETKSNERDGISEVIELAELSVLEQNVFIRLQLFVVLSLWNLYLLELQNKLINTQKNQQNKLSFSHIEDLLAISLSIIGNNDLLKENSAVNNTLNLDKLIGYSDAVNRRDFQEIFYESIKKDMSRSDTIEENIDYILDEIKGCCEDYLTIKGLFE